MWRVLSRPELWPGEWQESGPLPVQIPDPQHCAPLSEEPLKDRSVPVIPETPVLVSGCPSQRLGGLGFHLGAGGQSRLER